MRYGLVLCPTANDPPANPFFVTTPTSNVLPSLISITIEIMPRLGSRRTPVVPQAHVGSRIPECLRIPSEDGSGCIPCLESVNRMRFSIRSPFATARLKSRSLNVFRFIEFGLLFSVRSPLLQSQYSSDARTSDACSFGSALKKVHMTSMARLALPFWLLR